MDVDNFNVSRLRNAEFVSLGNDVLEITKSYDWAKSNVIGFYTKLETSVGNFKLHLNKLNTVTETEEVAKADVAFNNAWRAFKYICKSYELHHDKVKQEAAKRLIEVCKTHGYNLHNESYQEQNASAKMFIIDCFNKAEVKKAIETLAIQESLDNIELSLDTLIMAIKTRKNKWVNERRDENTKLLRQKLATSLGSMFKYIEAMSVIAPGGELDNIIKKINESIRKLELSVKMRKTHNTEEIEQN